MSTTIRPLAILALTLTVVGGACSAGTVNLANREFLSVAVTDGGAAKPLVPGTRISLRFEGTTVSANAGCNTMGASYRIDGGRLAFESGGTTAMGCEPALHAQDEWLTAFLGSRPTIRLVGNDLTLEGATTVIRLLDREVAQPDLNIVGPVWTVESIMSGDAVSSVPGGATATLVFQADGTVEVNAGCNRGSGTWQLEGAGLKLGPIMLTKMACDGAAGALEAAVLAVIGAAGTLAANIEADTLTLQGAGGGLQLRGG